jgi:hypothetical protein
MLIACQPERIEPASALTAPLPPGTETAAQPPKAPTRNCQVTVVNASTNAFAHMMITLSPDLAGMTSGPMHCPISPGAQMKICLPVGEVTLYTFSNMYQFSDPIRVTIGTEPMTLRLKSGY